MLHVAVVDAVDLPAADVGVRPVEEPVEMDVLVGVYCRRTTLGVHTRVL